MDVGGNPTTVVVLPPAVELQRVGVEERGVLSSGVGDCPELVVGQPWELPARHGADDLLGVFQLEHPPDRNCQFQTFACGHSPAPIVPINGSPTPVTPPVALYLTRPTRRLARDDWLRQLYGFEEPPRPRPIEAAASQQVLWDYARRYWLCDKLMLPTEADAYPPDTDGDASRRRTQR